MKEYALGAPYVLIGDPTEASGGGMFDLGLVPSATVRITTSKSRARDVGGTPRAAGAFDRGVRATIEIQVYDTQAEVMRALLTNAEGTDDLEFNTTYRKMTPPTLVIIPNGHEDDVAGSNSVWYMPAADSEGTAELTYNDTEGNEANNAFTVTFEALLRETDQSGAAIPAGKQVIWRGGPLSGWSFPARYTAD